MSVYTFDKQVVIGLGLFSFLRLNSTQHNPLLAQNSKSRIQEGDEIKLVHMKLTMYILPSTFRF